jgi:hypothetical protein
MSERVTNRRFLFSFFAGFASDALSFPLIPLPTVPRGFAVGLISAAVYLLMLVLTRPNQPVPHLPMILWGRKPGVRHFLDGPYHFLIDPGGLNEYGLASRRRIIRGAKWCAICLVLGFAIGFDLIASANLFVRLARWL